MNDHEINSLRREIDNFGSKLKTGQIGLIKILTVMQSFSFEWNLRHSPRDQNEMSSILLRLRREFCYHTQHCNFI